MLHRTCPTLSYLGVALALAATAACSDDALDSDEAARRAYLGLDPSIEKSLNLGFAGYNDDPQGANIRAQSTQGAATGTLTVTGQVDQGSSSNKEMRLRIGMVDYSEGRMVVVYEGDEVEVNLTYDTSSVTTEQPYLQLSLRNVPDGTFTGSLTGDYHLRGDLQGVVTLNLSLAGDLQAGDANTVVRVPGSTTVTGTATSGDGVYQVNLTI